MLKVIKDDIAKFLEIIKFKRLKEKNEEQFVDLRLIHVEDGVKQEFLTLDKVTVDYLYEIAVTCYQNKNNFYIGYTLRDERAGKQEKCSYLSTFIVDYDEFNGEKIKEIEDEAVRQQARKNLLEGIKKLDPAPTMVVSSGRGYHCYFSLQDSVKVKNNLELLREKIEGLNKRSDKLPGDPAMKSLSQPIRLPGTINCKDLDDLKQCEIIIYNPQREYELEDFP